MQRTKPPLRNGPKPPLPPRPPASVLERNAKRTTESPSGKRIRSRSISTAERACERDSTSVIRTTVSTSQYHLKSDSLNGSCTNIANATARDLEQYSSALPRRKVKEDVNTRQMQLQAPSFRRPRTICTSTVADPTMESKRVIMDNPAGRTIRTSINRSTCSNQLQQMSPSDGSRSRLCNGAKEPPKSSYRPPRPIRPPKTIPRVTKPNFSPEAKTRPARPPPPVHRRFKRAPMPLLDETDQNGPKFQPSEYSYIDTSVKRMLYPSESRTSATADFLDGIGDNHKTQEMSGFNIYSELNNATKEKDDVYEQLQGHDVTDTFSPDQPQSLCACGYEYESLTKSTMEQVSNYTVPSYNTSH